MSQDELGRTIALDRSTTSVVFRSLPERRLVRGQADPEDLRKQRLNLTDAGRLVLGEADRLSADSSQQLLATLGERKVAPLLSLLEELSTSSRTGVAN